MRWPWQRIEVDESEAERAQESLARARADEPRVARLVTEHRRKQEENHFGPKIHAALSLPRRETR